MPTPQFILDLRKYAGNTLIHAPTVTILILDESDRVLLVRNAHDDLWTTPGGFVEPYEIPADAAVREAYEETGLTVELVRMIGVLGGKNCIATYPNGDKVSWVSTVFEARAVSGEPRPDNEEVTEIRYFSADELTGDGFTPHVIEFLQVARRRAPDGYFQPPTWSPG